MRPRTSSPMDSDTATEPTMAADGATVIDVMVVWTPAARAAAGGTSAIQSLVLSSVANANLAYANSQVNARLRLVHSAEVAFTEGAITSARPLVVAWDHRRKDRRCSQSSQSVRRRYRDVDWVMGMRLRGPAVNGYLMSSPSTSFAQPLRSTSSIARARPAISRTRTRSDTTRACSTIPAAPRAAVAPVRLRVPGSW